MLPEWPQRLRVTVLIFDDVEVFQVVSTVVAAFEGDFIDPRHLVVMQRVPSVTELIRTIRGFLETRVHHLQSSTQSLILTGYLSQKRFGELDWRLRFHRAIDLCLIGTCNASSTVHPAYIRPKTVLYRKPILSH